MGQIEGGKGVLEAADLLKRMVSYNTVSSGISGIRCAEADLVRFLEGYAGSLGLKTRRLAVPEQADNLLILYEADPYNPWILFDSHLDTVSTDGMTIDPFAGETRDGRIYARGACDTKGTGAAMLTALAGYAAGGGGRNNIALLFSVDEEWGMTGIRSFMSSDYPDLNFKVLGAIVGEPTELKPVISHNGVVRYIIQTHGLAVHSSNPSLGRSAISSMARLIIYLEEQFIPKCDRVDKLTGKAQCSINVIRGGTTANIIPDLCEIHVDRRTVPGETSQEAVAGFERAVRDFEKKFPDDPITWNVSVDTPVLNSSVGGLFVSSVLSCLEAQGFDGKPVGVTYATHAGDLSVGGISSIVLGPGSIAQGHTKDEWIDIGELQRGVEVYLALMNQLSFI